MTRYFVQAITDDGELLTSIKTNDYGVVMEFAERAHAHGLSIREPWADLTTESRHDAGWGVSTRRKLIAMSKAHKEGGADTSL